MCLLNDSYKNYTLYLHVIMIGGQNEAACTCTLLKRILERENKEARESMKAR